MKDSRQIRIENARALAAEAGGFGPFGEKIGKTQSQVSQLIGETKKEEREKHIGHAVAREIEKAFGLEHGWLDWPPVRRERQKYHDLIDYLNDEQLKKLDTLFLFFEETLNIKPPTPTPTPTIEDQSAKYPEDKPEKPA